MSVNSLALPNSHILKLLKASLQAAGSPNVQIAAETRDVINKATCLFILYLTNAALDECNKGKKKRSTLSPADVLAAVQNIDISLVTSYVEAKADLLEHVREEKKHKRDEEKKRRAHEDAENGEEEEEEENTSSHKRARLEETEETIDDMANPFV